MPPKPAHAVGYTRDHLNLVRATCLYVATKLGDLLDDIVVVGGLVPSLIIDQAQLPDGVEPHVGTRDLDLGLTVALLNEQRYRSLTETMRACGFTQDTNDAGKPTRQRWREPQFNKVTIDFLIPPSRAGDKGGTLRHIEPDFAALIAPGLRLAFRDRLHVQLSGPTLTGAHAERLVWVSGVGAYTVLKALAFANRTENKDAYDLIYVLRNYGSGPSDVAAALRPLLDDEEAVRARDLLRRDFASVGSIGPHAVAQFLFARPDDEVQAEAAALVAALLAKCS
jgi:predicted nucleotidyltransferase